jgi:3-deoxy-D-manno-octulosonate 8-phosphate phosphatase (KDO 8-P phosphatase)
MIDATLARRIKLVGLDVDGVLTDAGVFVGLVQGQRVELKRFDIQDGLGVKLLRQAGLVVALVSGRQSEATTLRAREIGVDELVQDDAARKLPALEGILARRGLRLDECAFVGDDLADLPVLRRVALPVAVANAVPDVQAVAAYVTRAAGGQGAVREVAEVLLRARGQWEALRDEYVRARAEAEPNPRALGSG